MEPQPGSYWTSPALRRRMCAVLDRLGVPRGLIYVCHMPRLLRRRVLVAKMVGPRERRALERVIARIHDRVLKGASAPREAAAAAADRRRWVRGRTLRA